MDNHPVWFISNYHESESVAVRRKNKKGEKVEVTCPEVAKDYNSHMSGVGLADQLIYTTYIYITYIPIIYTTALILK